MKRRILSILLALIMAVGMLPITVFAAENTGNAITSGGFASTEDKWKGSKTENLIPTPTLPSLNLGDGKDKTAWKNNWNNVMVPAGWGSAGISGDDDALQVYSATATAGGSTFAIRPVSGGGASSDACLGGAGDLTVRGTGVSYTVKLDRAAQELANAGDLTTTAKAEFYREKTYLYRFGITFEFYNASGKRLSAAGSSSKPTSGYDTKNVDADGVHYNWYALSGAEAGYLSRSVSNVTVPADTVYIRYWYANLGGGNARKAVRNMQAYLTNTSSHTHSWSSDWSFDEGHHWHECTAEGCEITANSSKNGYAAHSFSGNVCSCRLVNPSALSNINVGSGNTAILNGKTVEGTVTSNGNVYLGGNTLINATNKSPAIQLKEGGVIHASTPDGAAYSGDTVTVGVDESFSEGDVVVTNVNDNNAGKFVLDSNTHTLERGTGTNSESLVVAKLADYTIYLVNGEIRKGGTSGDIITVDGITASGNATDGYTYTLNGFDFTTTNGTGVYVSGDATLVLSDDNIILSNSTETGSSALYCSGELTIKGDGSLVAEASDTTGTSNGIYAGSGLIVESGNVTGIGGDGAGEYQSTSGVYSNGGITVTGGTLTGRGGTPGSSGSSYGVYAFGSDGMIISGSTVIGSGDTYGIYARTGATATGATVTVADNKDGTGATQIDSWTGASSDKWVQVVAPAHTHDDVTFTEWTATDSLPTTAGNYYLTADVTVSSTWTTPTGKTTLCLNGHIFNLDSSYIEVMAGDTLNICDCQSGGKITSTIHNTSSFVNNGVIHNNGTFTLSGGTIENTYSTANSYAVSAIYNTADGSVTISGGAVKTSNKLGYAIYNSGGGSIAVSGGEVSATGTGNYIYGIYNNSAGSVTISGSAQVSGVQYGVFNNGTGDITISGGTISSDSRGISVGKGTVTVTGGTISGGANGIFSNSNDGTVIVKGGTIIASGDSGYGIWNNGGSIYLSGAPTISGTLGAIEANYGGTYIYAHDGGTPAVAYSGGELVILEYGYRKDGVVVYGVTNGNKDKFTFTNLGSYTVMLGTGENANNLIVHEHAYSIVEYDNDNHWNECSCGEKQGVTAHDTPTDDGDCTTDIECSCGKVLVAKNSSHTYIYTATVNVITETCSVEGCTSHTATARVNKPIGDAYTYDGTTEFTGSITYSSAPWNGGELTISYTRGGNSTSDLVSAGEIVASITKDGKTASVTYTVQKADKAAPTDVGKSDTSYIDTSDGKITGVTTAMEYKLSTAANYTAVSGTEITGLTAGTYYVRYKETDNYKASADTGITIFKGGKRTAAIDITAILDKTYDGIAVIAPTKNNGFTYDGDGQITVKLYADDNGSKGAEISAPINAGTYWIGVSAAEGDTYNAVSEVTKQFVINPLDISGASITLGEAITYNGKEQTKEVVSVKVGTLEVTTYTVEGNKATDYVLGGYILTVTGTGNFTGTKTATWSIGRLDISNVEITLLPLIYNGYVQDVPVSSVKLGDIILTSSDYDILGTTAALGAGTHSSSIHGKGNFKGAKTFKWTITPLDISDATIFLGTAPTYNGTEQTQSIVNINVNGVVVNSYTVEGDKATNVGASDYILTVTGTGNFTGTANKAWNIGKAQAEISVDTTPIVKTYGEPWTLPVASSSFGTPVANYTVGEMANAYVYTLTFTVAETDNYYGDTESISVTINKAKVTKPTADSTVFTYTGSAQTYTVAESTLYTVSGTEQTNAGNYKVTISLKDTANYEWDNSTTADLKYDFNIGKANYDMSGITFEDGQFTYDGEAHSLVIGGTLPTGADGIQVTVDYSGSAANVSDGEVTVTAAFATTSTNYNVPTAMTADVKINAKDITNAEITLGTALIYTGEAQTQTVIGVVIDGFDVTYTTSGDTGTNATDYELTVTGNGNFTGTAKKAWSIGKAPQPKPSGVVGVGTRYNNTTDGKITGVTAAMEYKLSTATDYTTISGTEVTGLASGIYYVRYKADSNHYASEYVEVRVSRGGKRSTQITFNSDLVLDKVYDGTAVSLGNGDYTYVGNGKVTITWYADNSGTKGDALTGAPTNAGTYWVGVSASESSTYHATAEAAKKFVISKAQAVISVDTTDIVKTYGESWTLPTVTATFGTPTADLAPSDMTNAGTYTVTYTVKGTSNFNGASQTISVTIAPKDISGATILLGKTLIENGTEQEQDVVSVTLGDFTVTYEVFGNRATDAGEYELTVKGTGNFTGSESKKFVVVKRGATNEQGRPSDFDDIGSGTVDIGNGSITVDVKKDEAAPESKLESSKSELIGSALTAEELSDVAGGASVEIWVDVKNISESISEQSKAAIENAVSDYTVGLYLDINLFKKLSNESEATAITNTDNLIKISIAIPEELVKSGTRSYYIVRNHDGQVEILDTIYNESTNTVTFETDKFSDYALAYKDTCVICHERALLIGNLCWVFWLIVLTVAAAASAGGYFIYRYVKKPKG